MEYQKKHWAEEVNSFCPVCGRQEDFDLIYHYFYDCPPVKLIMDAMMTILEQDFKSSHSIINGQLIMNPNKGGKPVNRSPADHIRLIIFHDLPHPIRNAESSLKASIAVNVCQTTAQALKTSASYKFG